MSRRVFGSCALGWLAAIVGYAALDPGTRRPTDWALSLFILGLAGVVAAVYLSRLSSTFPCDIPVSCVALLPTVYVLLQLTPLPLPLLRVISPTRSELLDALGNVMSGVSFAPLSIFPASTLAYLPRIIGYILVFLIVCEIARNSTRRPWAPAVPLILLAGFEAVIGLRQFSAAESVSGTYPNKDHFACLLEMVLPFAITCAISLLYRSRERGRFSVSSIIKIGAVSATAAVSFMSVAFSFSRMGFISMLGSLLLIGVLAVGFGLKSWVKWPVIAGLALLVLLSFVFLSPNELVQRFGDLSSGQAEGRGPIWKDTLHLAADYPLFGCGLGNFYPGLLKYQTSSLAWTWRDAHNDYLQLFSELGGIGLLIAAILMIAVFARAVRAAVSGPNRETRLLGFGCVGGLAGILIHSFADFNFYIPANAMVCSWIAGLSVGLPLSVPDAAKKRSRFDFRIWKIVLVLACLLTLNSLSWVVFAHTFRGDPHIERVFCHFGVCDTTSALNAEIRMHAGTVAAVPISELEEFTRRDPAGPYRWEDLGEAMQRSGEIGKARYCFSRALVLGPHIPYMLYRAANFYFAQGENRKAVQLMARTLEGDPGYEKTVFGDYQRRRIAVDEILRYGLPDRRAYQEYLRFLVAEAKSADAEKTWEWIVAHRYADDKLANEYGEFLIGKKEYEAGQKAWVQYVCERDKGNQGVALQTRASAPQGDKGNQGGSGSQGDKGNQGVALQTRGCAAQANRVFNGDFELDPSGSRFDWRIEAAQGAAIDFDRAVHYSGARSLRIQFDGTQNVSNIGVGQSVFLKPGRYRFEAYVRTRDVSTDEGVAFRVVAEAGGDSGEGNRRVAQRTRASAPLNFTTEGMLGTSDWKVVEREFEVRPGMGLVQVSLVRKPSLRFDNLVHGTVWVDQVRIRPL